jgi:ribonuclease E
MKRMLFNATQAEELRVAIVDGQRLIDLDIESAAKEQRKSNIYKGVITRVEPSLEAVFLDYGAERHGFLPFKEIAKQFRKNEDGEFGRNQMADGLRIGQEVIVQVEKDERGNKGAALTTYISLAGRYLVLMPNNPRGGGVSRRVEGEDRNELREMVDQLEVPEGMSVIARTAGIGRTLDELKWDMNYLLQLWKAIEDAAHSVKGPELIYLESSLVVRAIRDLYQPDIGEILIDTPAIYEQAQSFMSTVMPGNVHKVKLYKDDVPLFSRFQIEHQIESAFRRDVNLPSGGAIVIDHTEALVAVDVNSARATKGSDIEETALRTNLEAADEIARQLRLRDLGGLIVIDFIDMESAKSQREVENRLRDALRYDRARVQTSKLSRFGLLELSRQRLQPSLGESSNIPCPRCHGTGHIRDTASTALHILRIIQEEAMKEGTAAIHAQVPVAVATYLLNEKRYEFLKIETRFKVNVLLIPNQHLETPNYEVQRHRHDSAALDSRAPSYELAMKPEAELKPPSMATKEEAKTTRPEPLVKGITPTEAAPVMPDPTPEQKRAQAVPPPAPPVQGPAIAAPARKSWWDRVTGWFSGTSQQPAEAMPAIIKESQPAPAPTPAPTPIAREERPARDGRRDGRGRRDERPARNGRDEKRDRNDRDGRKEGRDRNRREEHTSEPRKEALAGSPPVEAAGKSAPVQPPREAREPRERGPRRERERRERQDAAPIAQAHPSAPAEADSSVPASVDGGISAPREREARPEREPRGDRGPRRERGGRERRRERGLGEGDVSATSTPAKAEDAAVPQVSSEITHSAVVAQTPAPLPAASTSFRVVSEHEASPETQARKPRRREQISRTVAQAQPLVFIETRSGAAAPASAPEEEPARKPYRRPRPVAATSGPLQFVETKPGVAQTPQP